MRNICKIFISDIRGVGKSFLAVFLVVAICIIPALYAWLNIYACWDPYGGMSKIKIAYYCEDQSYTLDNGKTVSMTDGLLDDLRDEYDIGWTPVDTRAEALNGVEAGDYYAAVVIEDDFTKSLFTTSDGEDEVASIAYYENEKKNAIATRMTNSAGDALKRCVNRRYIDTLTETIFGKLNEWNEDFDTIDGDVDATENSLTLLKTNMLGYQDTLSAFIAGNNKLENTVDSLNSDVDNAIAGINDVIDSMNNQSAEIEGIKDDLPQSQEDANTALDNIQSQVGSLSEKLDRLSDIDTPEKITAALTSVDALLGNLSDQTKSLRDILDSADKMDANIDTVSQTTIDSINYLVDQTDTLLDDTQALMTLLTFEQTLAGAGYDEATINGIMSSPEVLSATLSSLVQNQMMSAEQAQAIGAAAQRVSTRGITVEKIQSRATELQNQYEGLRTSLPAAATNAGKLLQDSGVTNAEDTLTRLEKNIDTKLADVNSQLDSLKKIGTAESPTVAEATQMLTDAKGTISDTHSDLDVLESAFKQIGGNGSKVKTDKILDLIEDTQDDLEKMQDLTDSAQKLLDTTGDAQESLTQIGDLAAHAQSVVNDDFYPCIENILNDMSDIMDETTTLLMNAQGTLADSSAIFSGVQLTLNGANNSLSAVQTVLNSLSAHISPLIDDMESARNSQIIADLKTLMGLDPDTIGDFFADPINMDETDIYPVENYGTGLAAFYTSLGIWIGCIFQTVLYKIEPDGKKLKNPKNYQMFFGRYLIFALTGVIQTLVIMMGDMHLLNIQCVNPGLLMLSGIVSSITFSLFVYALVLAFGNIGRALVIIILVVQIAGSGGTYPIELLPEAFGAVYRFFPFYYSIGAMREAICGIYQNDFNFYLTCMLIFIGIALVVGLVVRKPLRKINHYIDDQMEKTKLM